MNLNTHSLPTKLVKSFYPVPKTSFRVDLGHLRELYIKKEPIVSLILTDEYGARLAEEANVEVIVAAFGAGAPSFIPSEQTALLSDAVRSVREIRRANKFSFLVGDIPLNCYSNRQTILNAAQVLVRAGADAVKIEGGSEVSLIVQELSALGVAVVGHIGYMPKTGMKMRVRGTTLQDYQLLFRDAMDLIHSGAKALILELVRKDIASLITLKVPVPTFGIYSGSGASGQALVLNDLLDITDFSSTCFPKGKPKSIGDWDGQPEERVRQYFKKVKAGEFPIAVVNRVDSQLDIDKMWRVSEGNHYK